MEPIGIFAVASKQAEWLTVRQSVVADNIANVNTPDFKAQDITPFKEILNRQSSGATSDLSLATTNPKHLSIEGSTPAGINVSEEDGLAVSASGNSVAIAHELIKSTEIRHNYEMNTGLVKALNSMIMLTIGK